MVGNWSRAPVLPRVSPRPKRGGFADSLARDVEIGGLCGHCSRDLPLDRRLLFVAELTGRMKWWVVSVTLRRWSGGRLLYRQLTIFTWLTTRGVVDRPGFAPGSSACKADDLLTDRAAHWKSGCGGRIRTGDARRMRPLPYRLATPRL